MLVKKIKQEKYDPRPNLTSLFLLAGGIEYLSLIEQASLCKKLTSVIKKTQLISRQPVALVVLHLRTLLHLIAV